MSLILEALRKSEAERRRAQVPDLLTESTASAPVATPATPRWPLWAAGAVIVLAAAWFATTRDAAVPSNPEAVAATPAQAPSNTPGIEAPAAAPARPAPALQRPLVVAAPAPAKPADTTPPPATEPAPQPIASAARPERIEPIATPPVSMPASAPAIERVTDLASTDRKQLPPLKLSMHMWNDVVAQRFVIIDGTRLSVGDRIGAVVVADIVPDGVLLDWNGRALKLPLR